MSYSERVVQAFDLARRLHHDQTRKGTDIPYLTHLMAVAALVGAHGGSEDAVIAALLHDAVEDQGGAPVLDDIRSTFGSHIADLVAFCTDAYGEPKPPWRERKEAFVAKVRQAPPDAKLVIAADKLHNLRSTLADHRRLGEALWDRFTASREESLWYYEAVLEALGIDWHDPILDEMECTLARLRKRLARPN